MDKEFRFVIGLIVMGASAGIEREFHRRVPDDIGIVTTRVPFEDISEQGLLKMIEKLPEASLLLLEAKPDVIVVTSASGSYMKSEEIINTIQQTTGVPVIIPSMEYVKILKSIHAGKIAIISTLGQELQLLERMFYHNRNISVDKIISVEGVKTYDPYSVRNLDKESILEKIKETEFSDMEAVIFDHPLINLNSSWGTEVKKYIKIPMLSLIDVLIESALSKAEKNSVYW